MTTGGIISIGFLAVLVLLVLRGIRGHGNDGRSGTDSDAGPDATGGGGD